MAEAWKKGKRTLGTLLILVLIAVVYRVVISASTQSHPEPIDLNQLEAVMKHDDYGYDSESYAQYLERYKQMPSATKPIGIAAASFMQTDNMEAKVVSHYEGSAKDAVITGEAGVISWRVDVPEDGLYHIGIRYFPVAGSGSAVERELHIDGKPPFEEAKKFVFTRVWGNQLTSIERDRNGNDLRPVQVEHSQWQYTLLHDAEGYYSEPLVFYFTKGAHTLSLHSLREAMAIESIELIPKKEPPSYDEALQTYTSLGYTPAKDVFITVQGEDAVRKSNPSLFPRNDRSSPATTPYHVSKIRMNTIGGPNWKLPGQWIEWEVEVPTSGLYEIGMRFRENLVRGVDVSRKLTIDGEQPFRELNALSFPYRGDWQVDVTKSDDSTPYLYYLSAGKHVLRLEVTMGQLAEVLQIVRAAVDNLNALYLKIITITGTVPDPFRDYQLEASIPELNKLLKEQSDLLSAAAAEMDALAGGTSSSTAIFRSTAHQLLDLSQNVETLPSRLAKYKDNITSLGTWILTVTDQPLEIDYLFVKSPDMKLPDSGAGFFKQAGHTISSFFHSFTGDYSSVASVESKEAITVWVTSGRDQAQLIRSLIDNQFTPQSGIEVNLKLVEDPVVLPATLAGKGPDVAIAMGNVINFAMRNALVDLTQFADFEEVKAQFMDSAFPGYRFKTGIYAIPDTQMFPVMFYREDIFKQLGLEVPNTWDDVYQLIPELKKKNMEIALPTLFAYEMLLYQNGGAYFEDDGMVTGLDSRVGMSVFREWLELYQKYDLPVEFDFMNRFRSGEMPIGIAYYNVASFLSVFAPEIKGKWKFTLLPGTVGEDGQLHREMLSTSAGTAIFSHSNKQDAAWQFVKWWTSADTQAAYGKEMEAILGQSVRYTPANLEALKRIPWTASEYGILIEQLKAVVGRPEVPGGYMLDRHLVNAFYEVFKQNEEPRETVEKYASSVNNELTIKRREFGLPTK